MSAKNVEILKDIMLGKNEQATAILEKCNTPNSPEEAVEVYYAVAGKLGLETTKDEVRKTLEALAAEKRQQTEVAVNTMQQLDLDELENVVGGDDDYYNEKDVDEYYEERYLSKFEPDLIVYRVGDHYGLMNPKTGKVITPAKFGNITMISKGLLRAELNSYNNESVLLDRNGNVIE